VQFAARQPI